MVPPHNPRNGTAPLQARLYTHRPTTCVRLVTPGPAANSLDRLLLQAHGFEGLGGCAVNLGANNLALSHGHDRSHAFLVEHDAVRSALVAGGCYYQRPLPVNL